MQCCVRAKGVFTESVATLTVFRAQSISQRDEVPVTAGDVIHFVERM